MSCVVIRTPWGVVSKTVSHNFPSPRPSGSRPLETSSCSLTLTSLEVVEDSCDMANDVVAKSVYLSSQPHNQLPKCIECVLGVSSVSKLDSLIDVCLKQMIHTEDSSFHIKLFSSSHSNYVLFRLRMKLDSFNHVEELHSMSSDQLMRYSEELNSAARHQFQVKNLEEACWLYGRAVKFLLLIDDQNSPQAVDEKSKLMATLKNNLAGCLMALKSDNWETVLAFSNFTLNIFPSNVKALYRRGCAYLALQEYERAREDFECAKRLEPGNASVQQKLHELEEKEQRLKEKYSNAMKKMFS